MESEQIVCANTTENAIVITFGAEYYSDVEYNSHGLAVESVGAREVN